MREPHSDRVYFTREEAEALVDTGLEALAPFPSVPKGTTGRVQRAVRYARDYYVVEVKWDLPQPNEVVDLTVVEISFNFLRKRKPVKDRFCKSEFAELVSVQESADGFRAQKPAGRDRHDRGE